MRSVFEYIKEYKLILVKWSGQWNIEDYIKYLDSFLKEAETCDIQRIIHDITDIEYKINLIELYKLIKIRKDKIKQDFKVVYITSKPNHVVFSELYSNALPDKRSHMYCSSTKKALELLSINMSEKELEDRLSDLLKA